MTKKQKEPTIIKAHIYAVNGEINCIDGEYQVIPFKEGAVTAWRSTDDNNKHGRLVQLIPCEIKLLEEP